MGKYGLSMTIFYLLSVCWRAWWLFMFLDFFLFLLWELPFVSKHFCFLYYTNLHFTLSLGNCSFLTENTEMMMYLQVILKLIPPLHFQIQCWSHGLHPANQNTLTGPGWRYQYQWSLAPIVLLWDFHTEDWKEILFSPLYYELKSCDLRSGNGHICHPVEKPEKWELWRCRSWEMRAGMRRALDKSYLSLWFQSLGPVLYFIFHALIT